MCAEMEFSRGRGRARGEVHFAGGVVTGSIFVLVVVMVRCVCIAEGEVALRQLKD